MGGCAALVFLVCGIILVSAVAANTDRAETEEEICGARAVLKVHTQDAMCIAHSLLVEASRTVERATKAGIEKKTINSLKLDQFHAEDTLVGVFHLDNLALWDGSQKVFDKVGVAAELNEACASSPLSRPIVALQESVDAANLTELLQSIPSYSLGRDARLDVAVLSLALKSVFQRLHNLRFLVGDVLRFGRANPAYMELQAWEEARRLVATDASWRPEKSGAKATWIVANHTLLVEVPGPCQQIRLMKHGEANFLDLDSTGFKLVEGVGTLPSNSTNQG